MPPVTIRLAPNGYKRYPMIAAVVLVVEELAAKGEELHVGHTQAGAHARVGKRTAAGVLVKRIWLVGKVADEQALEPGVVIVGHADSHPGKQRSGSVVSASRFQGDIC